MKPPIDFAALHDPSARDHALMAIGQWVVDTCLVFGCPPETAWQVAAIFTRGLRNEMEETK